MGIKLNDYQAENYIKYREAGYKIDHYENTLGILSLVYPLEDGDLFAVFIGKDWIKPPILITKKEMECLKNI